MAFYLLQKSSNRLKSSHYVDGELVGELQAPELWLRVRNLAARLKTHHQIISLRVSMQTSL